MEQKTSLRVGAGRAPILLPPQVFPTYEGYTGVHDDPHARLLLLKSGEEAFAVLTLELVSVFRDEMERIKAQLGEIVGAPPEHIWFCVTHSLPTPHLWGEEQIRCPEDREKDALLRRAIGAACLAAAQGAADSLQPARYGFGTGSCAINVNRNVLTKDGWWLGSGEGGPVDRTVPVLRFDGLDGRPIALLYGYNSQPSVMDGSFLAGGGRLVSGDLAGAASRFVEEQFGGETVALFCIGAGGDQGPAFKAKRTVVGRDGAWREEDLHEAGFLLLDLLGERLGEQVVRTAEAVSCAELTGPVRLDRRVFSYPGQFIPDMHSIRPSKDYRYVPEGEKESPVEVLQIGDTALVGVQPELCCRTETALRERSPFPHTLAITFVNGGAKYMAEADYYDQITFQSMNSRFAKGSAEQFLEHALGFLRELKARNGGE